MQFIGFSSHRRDLRIRSHRNRLIVDSSKRLPNILEFFAEHPSIEQNSQPGILQVLPCT
jgi:hypothetical protein